MLTYFHAIILSIVEGLTEFIPVSSTGHMIIVSAMLQIEDQAHKTFEIFIQLGAILSVVVLYPRRFMLLWPFSHKNHQSQSITGYQGLIKFSLACAPVFVLGFIFHSQIKMYLFTPLTVALALIVGGVLMIFLESKVLQARVTKLEQVSYKDSFIIGIFQCLALWPGMSRSGATIIGAMLIGFQRSLAAEFSFLIAVPVMCVAVAYDLIKSIDLIASDQIPIFALGFIVSFFVSIIAIQFFISILKRVTLRVFGIYRIVLGVIVLALH